MVRQVINEKGNETEKMRKIVKETRKKKRLKRKSASEKQRVILCAQSVFLCKSQKRTLPELALSVDVQS